jgi:hypothetical protein
MAETGNPFGDINIAAELDALRARLGLLGDGADPEATADELDAIRDTLRRLSADTEEVRLKLAAALGLRVDPDTDDA